MADGYEYLACKLCSEVYPLEAEALVLLGHVLTQHSREVRKEPKHEE